MARFAASLCVMNTALSAGGTEPEDQLLPLLHDPLPAVQLTTAVAALADMPINCGTAKAKTLEAIYFETDRYLLLRVQNTTAPNPKPGHQEACVNSRRKLTK